MFGDEEFYEATTYAPFADEGDEDYGEDGSPAWQRGGGDAVVCLVDSSESMFAPLPADSSSTERGEMPRPSPPAVRESLFSMALQSIQKVITEKLKYTTDDALAVVLYNTRESLNVARLPGVYVLLPLSPVGTASVRCVEQLEAAATQVGVAHTELLRTIGSGGADLPVGSYSNASAAPLPAAGPSLVGALQVALGAFHDDGAEQSVRERRVFVFTNDSDPVKGNAAAWEQCCGRAEELGKMNITLEVFGLGAGSTSAASPVAHARPTQSRAATVQEVPVWNNTESFGGASPRPSSATAHEPFNASVFWNRLLHRLQQQQQHHSSSESMTEKASTSASAAPVDQWARRSASSGGVHVHAGPDTLHLLLSSVAHRVHPQRPFQRCELRIGGLSSPGDSVNSVPRMAVSLFAPLVPAYPPPHELVEATTQLMVRRVVRHRAWHGRELAEGAEVPKEDLFPYAEVGGTRITFTAEERRAVMATAAAGAPLGFSILFFKSYDAVVRHAQSVDRSFVLHPNAAEGGPHALRLFVLLVRRLRAKGKVAVAQFRRSATVAPRLVALVPSPDLTAHPERRAQLPVEGMALYVVPLPYADDLRPVPDLRTCTLTDKWSAPCLESSEVSQRGRHLAERVVRAMTASYAIDAVANPALQRRYDVLQRLSTSTRGAGGSHGAAVAAAPTVEDSSLPDYEGMKLHARLFRHFNDVVLGSGYDASAYCPPPAAERCRPRSDGAYGGAAVTAEEPIGETVRRAVLDNDVGCLRVQQLRDYLRAVNVSAGPSVRKDGLLELVEAHVRSALHQS